MDFMPSNKNRDARGGFYGGLDLKNGGSGGMVSTHHFMQVDGLSTQIVSSKMSFKKEYKLENLDLLTSASIYSNSSGRNRPCSAKIS